MVNATLRNQTLFLLTLQETYVTDLLTACSLAASRRV